MCKASHEKGGPQRCSGDARAQLSRSAGAVQDLEGRSAALAANQGGGLGMEQELVDELYSVTAWGPARDVGRAEVLSLRLVIGWMAARGFDEIPVQDDSEVISRAALPDVDDEDLDHAVAWLPRDAFVNSTPRGGWNPVARLADLASHPLYSRQDDGASMTLPGRTIGAEDGEGGGGARMPVRVRSAATAANCSPAASWWRAACAVGRGHATAAARAGPRTAMSAAMTAKDGTDTAAIAPIPATVTVSRCGGMCRWGRVRSNSKRHNHNAAAYGEA